MTTGNHYPGHEGDAPIPGLEGAPQPIDEIAVTIVPGVASQVREGALSRADKASDSEPVLTRQEEVKWDQGISNADMAYGRTQRTGTEEPPTEKTVARSREYKPTGRHTVEPSGADKSREEANKDAARNPKPTLSQAGLDARELAKRTARRRHWINTANNPDFLALPETEQTARAKTFTDRHSE